MKLTEYQDLFYTSYKRLPMRTTLIPWENEAQALKGIRASSPWTLCLNGVWDFHMVHGPDALGDAPWDQVFDCQIQVPGTWQAQGFGIRQYTNVRFPIPYEPPFVPDDTDVGVYRRVFELPERFEGRRNVLRLEGVSSCYYLFVNGEYCGFTKGPHYPAEFDVTKALHAGENTVTVLVFRYSDGTYLEDQDMFRLNGIFRDVLLLSFGESRIEDVRASGEWGHEKKEGILRLEADLRGVQEVCVSLLDELTGGTKTRPPLRPVFRACAPGAPRTPSAIPCCCASTDSASASAPASAPYASWTAYSP